MSSLAHLFEDFTLSLSEATSDSIADLAGFDDGYKAGWEDATAAHRKTQDKLQSDLSQALQSSAFTFQEARVHVISALKPLITGLVRQTLPDALFIQKGALVAEALHQLISDHAPKSVVLHVPPSDRTDIELLLPADPSLDLKIMDDDSLASGQCRFAFDGHETELDLPEVLQSMQQLVADYFSQFPKEHVANG